MSILLFFLQYLVKNHSTVTTLALQVDDCLNQFHYNGQKREPNNSAVSVTSE